MNLYHCLRRLGLLGNIFVQRVHWRFYFRASRYFLRRVLLRKMIPVAAMIAVTYRCQCRCAHCAVAGAAGAACDELTTRELKECLDDLQGLGVLKIGFTGGEPLLREDLHDLVAHAYFKGFSVSLDTNGMLLSPENVQRLEKSGVTNINVSIDRPQASSHDRLRKTDGCFDKALGGIRECVRQRIPCVVSTYVTRWKPAKPRLQEIVLMARQLRATAVRVLFPVYSGKLAGKKTHLLSAEDKKDFFQTVATPGFVYSESPLFDYVTHKVECSAGRKLSIYITANGLVKPCYASNRILGDLRHSRIFQILGKSVYCRSRTPLPLECEPLC